MALPTLVLIHGGAYAADCWDLTRQHLRRLEPSLRVLAVDLPGRRGKPGDLATASVGEWVDSVVGDIEANGVDHVVLAAHSLAGLILPGVMASLGAARVREVVLASAAIPPEGMSVADSLLGVLGPLSRRGLTKTVSTMPRAVARFGLTNGMTGEQRRIALQLLVPESVAVMKEKVSRRDMPDAIPRTWILTLRDRVSPPKQQQRCIAALGGVHTTIYADTCHMLMISEPEWLARVLLQRCRLRSQ